MESLLGDEEDKSRETRVRLKMALSFDTIVGSCSKFYNSFRRLFSLW
jgi:hypothetical protein